MCDNFLVVQGEDDNVEGFSESGFLPRASSRENISARAFADLARENGVVVMDITPEADKRLAFKILLEEGTPARAVTRLDKEHGIYTDVASVVRWRDKTDSKLWVEVSDAHGREMERRIESESRARAIRAGKVADVAIDRAEDVLPDAGPLEVSKLLDSVVKAGATATNQVLQMSGRAVDGSSGSWEHALKALDKLGVLTAIPDTTAEDVSDAVVVDGQK